MALALTDQGRVVVALLAAKLGDGPAGFGFAESLDQGDKGKEDVSREDDGQEAGLLDEG